MGRPIIYKLETADAVIEAVADGSTIQAACDAAGVRRTTFLGWANADRGGLKKRLARAKAGRGSREAPVAPPVRERERPAVTISWEIKLNPAAQSLVALATAIFEIRKLGEA